MWLEAANDRQTLIAAALEQIGISPTHLQCLIDQKELDAAIVGMLK